MVVVTEAALVCLGIIPINPCQFSSAAISSAALSPLGVDAHCFKRSLKVKVLEAEKRVWTSILKYAPFFPRTGLLEARDWTLVCHSSSCDFWSRAYCVMCLSSHSCRFGVPCSLLNRASAFLVGNQKFLHYQFSDTKYITDFLFHNGFLVQYSWLFISLPWFLKHEFSCTSQAPTFLVLSITDWYRELWRLFCSGSDTLLLTSQQIDLSSQHACN